MKKKQKRYRPMDKRAVAVILIALLLTMGLTMYTPPDVRYDETITLTVQPGDTLWDLAKPYNKEGFDIRSYISMIMELNHLANQPLQPGQTILVPILH